uniref:Uncharacterized protein n=1 Tax=Arundo donax TaxID=35708 RepID=A0A0A9T296_ARUDO
MFASFEYFKAAWMSFPFQLNMQPSVMMVIYMSTVVSSYLCLRFPELSSIHGANLQIG